MADRSKIEWTDATWGPTRGCSRVSSGCSRCYAEGIAARFSKPGQPFAGFAIYDDRGPRWTGKVELVEEHLHDPLRWKRPRRVFVNSMSDLFHEELSAEREISRVFAVMSLAPHHTFQVLTKRAAKMREVLNDSAFEREVGMRRGVLAAELDIGEGPLDWPLPNVWLGVSVEDQAAADERIPHLIETPAAVRFLSCEPLLGPIDLFRPTRGEAVLDWVIVGGESGHGARPMQAEWAEWIVKQCGYAGAKPFVKQLGSVLGGRDHKNIDTFPADLRVREFPRA